MKSTLAAICAFTLLATVYLSVSVLLLRPPRANYAEWFPVATLIVAQSALTLAALTGRVPGGRIRLLVVAGGVAVMAWGGWWVHATLSGSHFEGYAIVLGSALVAQGGLTLVCGWSALPRVSSASE